MRNIDSSQAQVYGRIKLHEKEIYLLVLLKNLVSYFVSFSITMLLLSTYIKYYKGRLEYEKMQLNYKQSFLSKSINAVQFLAELKGKWKKSS